MTEELDIWLVTVGEPLHIEQNSRPLRTRLLARELGARGHRVRWWTSDYNHFAKSYQNASDTHLDCEEGYTLTFLHGRPYTRNLSIARQLNHIEIARHFRQLAGKLPVPDIIVCSFPTIELTYAIARYSLSKHRPYIIDVRDLWPDEISNRFPQNLRWLARWLVYPLTVIVSRSLSKSNAIFAVSKQYMDWALARAGRGKGPSDRILTLGYPDHPVAKAMRHRQRVGPGKTCTFFFSGSFNQSVDLTILIRAFQNLPDAPFRAILCGDGENLPRWREMAAGDNRIEFKGWCTSDQMRRFASEADVGLVCYRASSLVAMPNKLFEYMSFGLPVINSIAGEAATLVAETGVGINYKAEDIGSFTEALGEFANCDAKWTNARSAAITLYEERFMASRVIATFADAIECTV